MKSGDEKQRRSEEEEGAATCSEMNEEMLPGHILEGYCKSTDSRRTFLVELPSYEVAAFS